MVKLQSRAADYFILTAIIYLLFDGGISFLPLLLFLPTLVCVFSTNRTKNKKITDQCKKILETFFLIYIRLSKYSKYCGIQIKQTKRLKTEKVKMTKIDGFNGSISCALSWDFSLPI
jgi:hypothetical protein